MTSREAEKIFFHLKRALEVFNNSNRYFCGDKCVNCAFYHNDECFVDTTLSSFLKNLESREKIEIPNDKIRRPKEKV
jgi:hypothetical protein